METSKRNWPQILHPTAGETLHIEDVKAVFSPNVLLSLPAAVSEDIESGALWLTFDLPASEWHQLSPVLLLALERPPAAGNLQVTFSSRSLQPGTQVKGGVLTPPGDLL